MKQPVFSDLAYILLSVLLMVDNTKWAAALMDPLEQTPLISITTPINKWAIFHAIGNYIDKSVPIVFSTKQCMNSMQIMYIIKIIKNVWLQAHFTVLIKSLVPMRTISMPCIQNPRTILMGLHSVFTVFPSVYSKSAGFFQCLNFKYSFELQPF